MPIYEFICPVCGRTEEKQFTQYGVSPSEVPICTGGDGEVGCHNPVVMEQVYSVPGRPVVH